VEGLTPERKEQLMAFGNYALGLVQKQYLGLPTPLAYQVADQAMAWEVEYWVRSALADADKKQSLLIGAEERMHARIVQAYPLVLERLVQEQRLVRRQEEIGSVNAISRKLLDWPEGDTDATE
jgi:hypothetical protein